MNKKIISLLIVFTVLAIITAADQKTSGIKIVKKIELNSMAKNVPVGVKQDIDFGKIPLYFITNKGQVNEKAAFYAKASRYTLWLTQEGLVFDSVIRSNMRGKGSGVRGKKEKTKEGAKHPSLPLTPYPLPLSRDVSRLMFIGANKNPGVVPVDEAKLKVNYFKGNDKSKWNCDIPTSSAVLYKSLYKNIDLKVYGLEKQIEYDWIVKAGGDPGDIKFEYKNVKGTRIDEEGNLLIETDFGELMHKKPVSFQLAAAQKETVEAGFKKIAENTYGFEVGAYDKSRELIIDPVVLAYSTYLGGGSYDRGQCIAVDAGGSVYVTGYTDSTDFPTLNQYQGNPTNRDVYVTVMDTTQSGAAGLLYSTYLGGGNMDVGHGIAVDAGGNVYVTGYTDSTDFPTLNQYQGDQESSDAFVTVLDTTQSGAAGLLYSTYLGGGGQDWGDSIAVDAGGKAYVTGYTDSTDFPTLNQYQGDQGGYDGFVTVLDTTQSGAASLIYSTYLGGSDQDYALGIVVDAGGNAYVTGRTNSTDFPTLNQYQGDQESFDAFVTVLDTTQSGAAGLLYSTYLGGGSSDNGHGIAVDAGGNVYVTGFTFSTDFPILNQYQGDQADVDAFVTVLDTTQSGAAGLLYSTYLGGGSWDYSFDVAVDAGGNVYVMGYTWSTDFPTLNQYQGVQTGRDVFVTRLDTTQNGAAGLIYSTYLGGGSEDYGYGLAVDAGGNAYVTGVTESTDFPTLNQYQGDQGVSDGFVTRLSAFSPTAPTVDSPSSTGITATTATLGGNVSVSGGADITEQGIYWSIIDGFTPPGQGTKVSETGNWGTGSFTAAVDGLPPNTPIYFTAFATNAGGTGYSVQNTFTTLSPFITVTSPNGGENWKLGSTRNITWDSSGLSANLKITLWKDGSLTGVIAYNVDPAAGTYSWTVGQYTGGTAAPGTGYTVKIKELGTTVADFSDAPFSIYSLTVTSPNGGENWQIGSTQNITWNSQGVSGNVKITLYKDGVFVGRVADNLGPASGSYSWTVGNHSGGTAASGPGYTIKIKEIGATVSDVSDAAFTLTD